MIRALIVDDNDANLYLLSSIIQGNGWTVDQAHNGAEALTRASETPPDIVISDLLMPVMDGYTLLRQWKMDERFKKIPFVVYTATYTDPKDESLALDLGADAFIVKPLEPEPFLDRIGEILRKRGRGELSEPRTTQADEIGLQAKYSDVLVHKLEQKIFELEQLNNALQQEIVHRQLTEMNLRKSEERYRAIFDNASLGIFVVDDREVFQECNSVLLAMLGYTQQEMQQLTFVDITHPEDIENSRQNLQDVQAGKIANYRSEKRFVRKDGTTMWGDLSVSGIWDSKGRCELVIGVIADMTDRRNLEAQLLQAQKMEALGTLAGGIAHDFNNLLQAVLGYTEILIERRKSDSADSEALHRIHTAGRRGTTLIRNLLAFSRKVQPELSIVDLNREVVEIQKLLFHTIPKTIKIVVRSKDYVDKIMADASQISQILMNLAVNARDAMPEGGTLSIETENILLEDGYCRIHPELQPGDYVLLTVSDTGHGMDAQTLERIFDPFFSTKEVGKGTGLGLATVYGIVKQHHGHISCYSEPGKGTVFNIYFPAIKREDRAETPEEQVEPRRGSETILLADDEEILRDLGTNILENFGYHVLVAGDGQGALEMYKAHRGSISLVLLDLNMPKLDGVSCMTEILKLDPHARVLIATGLLEYVTDETVMNRGASGFVSKPYSTRKLLSQVREILDRNTSS